jgi:hypothetical protein
MKMTELEEVPDYVKAYDVSAERNEFCKDASYALFNDYKNDVIDKPALLRQISVQSDTKYEAAMMALFIGYMLSAKGVE